MEAASAYDPLFQKYTERFFGDILLAGLPFSAAGWISVFSTVLVRYKQELAFLTFTLHLNFI